MKRARTAQRVKKRIGTSRPAAATPEPTHERGLDFPTPRRPAAPSEQVRAHQQLLSEDAELPETYGETKIILVPVHPFLLHVYWDLSPDHLKQILSGQRRRHRRKEPRAVLRFYDVAGSGSTEGDSSSFDVDV